MLDALSDLFLGARNRLDYFLRETLTLGLPVSPENNQTLILDALARDEMRELMGAFAWDRWLAKRNAGGARVVDIGCRNFYLAPLLHALFGEHFAPLEIHGIEIDAHRRYRNLRTRADYGKHYAGSIPNGHYHAMDFRDWREPFEVGLLLNPFVTKSTLLAWGLPLAHFAPEEIYAHARRQCRGLLFVTHPSEMEREIGLELAARAGFRLLEERGWKPGARSAQRRPRLGLLFG
jgi:hypothetical protein